MLHGSGLPPESVTQEAKAAWETGEEHVGSEGPEAMTDRSRLNEAYRDIVSFWR
jgi:hypothetical protein